MKKIAVVLAALLMMVFAFSAVAETFSVAVVYSDTVDDKGWCQSMDTGIKNAIAKGYDIDGWDAAFEIGRSGAADKILRVCEGK